MKSFLSFIAAILLSYLSYSHWNKPTLLSKSNFEASTVLRWIQTVQIIHKKTHGTYTDSLQKIVFISGSEFSNSRQILEQQLGNYTGLSNPHPGPGPYYYYSILKGDNNDFLAEARYQSFAQNGEDVWQISSHGDVMHPVSSHLASVPLWMRISRYVILLLFLASLVFFVLAIRLKILKRRDAKITSKL
jgi:hypothetical protein